MPSTENPIEKLASESDPVSIIRSIIKSQGGTWYDSHANNPETPFEIHLLGISGSGHGARAAAKDWIEKARELPV